MRDLANALHFVRAISPAAAAAADNTPIVSAIVDLAGFDSLTFAIAAGQLADPDATFAVTMQHGDTANLADVAEVPPKALVGTSAAASFTFAEDDRVRKIGYKGSKRYVRLTVTPANNTGAAPISAVAILGNARHNPTATQS